MRTTMNRSEISKTLLVAGAKSVSVVIPVFNQSHLTRRCLESLFAHSLNLKEVFVVDNASKDDTYEVLLTFQGRPGPTLTLISNTENKGFGRAVNQGLRLCTGDYLVVLNNDTWLMPGWDAALIEGHFESGADFIGPYFYEGPFEADLRARAADFVARNRGHFRHHFVPILMMMTREAFTKLRLDHGGLFDERFFVTYEDTDLVERMTRLGLQYTQTGSCFIWHHSMATRSAPGALPPGYEQEGLKLFFDKWKFDPRPRDHTLIARLRRRWWKIKENSGRF